LQAGQKRAIGFEDGPIDLGKNADGIFFGTHARTTTRSGKAGTTRITGTIRQFYFLSFCC